VKRHIPVHLVEGDPETAARWLEPTRTVVGAPLPEAPYDLKPQWLVWPVVVEDHATCAAVTEATLRGVAVVIRLGDELTAADVARLHDDLERAGRLHTEHRTQGAAVALTQDQHRLLDALCAGATVDAAAAELHVSTRTASRMLAQARRAMGVSSNAEAIAAASQGDGRR